jgi:NAD(P)-dependent dehydrogenase (short-subunit alcohol dehydrogenase family)
MKNVKSRVSDEYIVRTRDQHEVAMPEINRCAAVIGVSPGNIGEAIAERLYDNAQFDTVAGTNEAAHNCCVPNNAVEFLHLASEDTTVDTLVVCCGDTWLDWIEDQPFGYIVEVLHNTLLAPMIVTQAFVRLTLNDPWLKHIVYVGSMAYTKVLNGSSPYCAAKAGLAHFSRCMAWELGFKGYRVFTVHPGNVLDTPMTKQTIDGLARYQQLSGDDAQAYWSALEPAPGFLTKEDIAVWVERLVTEENLAHASGSQIELAGGTR